MLIFCQFIANVSLFASMDLSLPILLRAGVLLSSSTLTASIAWCWLLPDRFQARANVRRSQAVGIRRSNETAMKQAVRHAGQGSGASNCHYDMYN